MALMYPQKFPLVTEPLMVRVAVLMVVWAALLPTSEFDVRTSREAGVPAG